MAFKFSLQSVLRYRGQQEQSARADYFECERLHKEKECQIADVEVAIINAKSNRETEGFNLNSYWLYEQYQRSLASDLERLQGELFGLASNMQKAKQVLLFRAKELKLLEKVRETQEQKYAKDEQYKEQRENDEMATSRFPRKNI